MPAPDKQLFSHLSDARQALVRVFQSVNYGCVQDLEVHDGEPYLCSPELKVLVDVRLDSEELTRDELRLVDFGLCAEVLKIEVRAGIPRRITLEKQLKDVEFEQSPAAR